MSHHTKSRDLHWALLDEAYFIRRKGWCTGAIPVKVSLNQAKYWGYAGTLFVTKLKVGFSVLLLPKKRWIGLRIGRIRTPIKAAD